MKPAPAALLEAAYAIARLAHAHGHTSAAAYRALARDLDTQTPILRIQAFRFDRTATDGKPWLMQTSDRRWHRFATADDRDAAVCAHHQATRERHAAMDRAQGVAA